MKGNSRKWTTRILALFSVLIISMGATAAFAQTETGQLTARVTDPHGAVIPGATVTVKQAGTGFSQTKTAGDEGLAFFSNLKPGIYDVTVNAKGFADLTKRAEVTVGAKLEVVMPMSTQAVTESVTVIAGESGVQVNTQTQELSDVVSSKQITELPTLTRNVYDFVGLSGNVQADVGGRGAGFSINGQRAA